MKSSKDNTVIQDLYAIIHGIFILSFGAIGVWGLFTGPDATSGSTAAVANAAKFVGVAEIGIIVLAVVVIGFAELLDK